MAPKVFIRSPRSHIKTFTSFLARLEECGEVRTIDAPLAVDRENSELDALTRHLQNTDGPAVILTNPIGLNTPDVPIIINLFGSRKTCSTCARRGDHSAKRG